ncbi:MAG: NAD(P)-dependent oxidoreductase [Bacteroidetes bacterium]|nr:NAD(P)-dependent oxidoreductase [Bacteroidota bacterium]
MTGATGFIGSHTVEKFLAHKWRVVCLIRPHHTSLGWLEGLPVEVITGDLLKPNSLEIKIKDVEYIVHIAGVTKAKKRSEYFQGNVVATQNLLDIALHHTNIKKFTYISSQSVAGPSKNGIPLDETSPCHPITTYGKSKLEAEYRCKKAMNKLPITILRPSAVYGPRDTDILEIFKWVARGFKPILGSGEKTVSLIYGPDLAEAIYQATVSEKTIGETYFVADRTIFTFSSLIDYIATLISKKKIPLYLPKGLVYSMAGITQFFSYFGPKPVAFNIEKAKDLLQKHWVCNPQKIYDHIGYHTTTSVYNGLQYTFSWYKKVGWL